MNNKKRTEDSLQNQVCSPCVYVEPRGPTAGDQQTDIPGREVMGSNPTPQIDEDMYSSSQPRAARSIQLTRTRDIPVAGPGDLVAPQKKKVPVRCRR